MKALSVFFRAVKLSRKGVFCVALVLVLLVVWGFLMAHIQLKSPDAELELAIKDPFKLTVKLIGNGKRNN